MHISQGAIFIMKAVQGSIGPEEFMWLLGFPHLKLVEKVAVNMSGSKFILVLVRLGYVV